MTDSVSNARAYLSRNDLAKLLFPHSDRPRQMFDRKIKALIAGEGFPPPERALGGVWDPVAVRRWQDSRIPEHLRGGVRIEGRNVLDLNAAARNINARLARQLNPPTLDAQAGSES